MTRARRIAGASLGGAALIAGVAACGTTSTVFGGGAAANRPTLTSLVRVEHSTVRAGQTVHAELVLRSTAGRVRVLDRACPNHFVALVLSSGRLSTGAAWTLPLCRPGVAFVARPGTTIYRLSVAATYGRCIMRGHPLAGGEPQCLRGNRMPPLPVGSYTVSVVEADAKLARELAHIQLAQVRVIGKSAVDLGAAG
jgi:hypothetical protein